MILKEVEEKLRKLSAIDSEKANQLWLYYLSGQGKERQEAEELIDILLQQKLGKDYTKKILLEPLSPKDCFGNYALGNVCYPSTNPFCSFGLREHEWIQHVLITGMTGKGKTNLAFQILKTFRKNNKPFMVFDWKRNYRDLLQLQEFKKTKIFTIGTKVVPFEFNPLIPPPGAEPGEWLMKLVDVIKHAYFVGEGVEYLLREGIDWLYEKCGIHNKSQTNIPKFTHLKGFIARQKLYGRMLLWKASAMRVLESLCFRHGLGSVVNADKEWNWKELLNSDVVLELDALSDSDKVFFVEAMILWIYEFRKNEGKREQFKHAMVIEEGHHILSHKKENVEGAETIMETSLRQIREFGEAVIVIDQEPSKLSNSIKANTYCKITFNLGNGKDVYDISQCMGLTDEEHSYINLLDIGHAIVSLKGRIFTPLHVAFPKIEVKKGLIQNKDIEHNNVVDVQEIQDTPLDEDDVWKKLR